MLDDGTMASDSQTRTLASADLNSGLEPMGPFECLRLLLSETVGRLAVVIGGKPEIFPVNYLTDDDDTVVFQTDSGTKLAAALGAPVAFEVDRLDRETHSGWSVVVHGTTHQVSLPEAAVLRARMAAQAAQPWPRSRKPYLIRIVPVTITGRRIPPPGTPSEQ